MIWKQHRSLDGKVLMSPENIENIEWVTNSVIFNKNYLILHFFLTTNTPISSAKTRRNIRVFLTKNGIMKHIVVVDDSRKNKEYYKSDIQLYFTKNNLPEWKEIVDIIERVKELVVYE